MSEFPSGPWWIVTAASAPSVASALWVLWRWWIERGDKLNDNVLTREQALFRDLEAQRITLSKEQGDLSERLRSEFERIQHRLNEMERERDRGWDLARWWNQRAHDLRHAGLNAQAMVVGFCSRDGVEVPTWPDMSVPGLEEPR